MPEPDEEESAQIMSSIQGMFDQASSFLEGLVDKADEFKALGSIAIPLINSDLSSLQTSGNGLADTLMAKDTSVCLFRT
jgi:hypothetical protein